MEVTGRVDPRFTQLRDAFANNFVEHNEIGAALCVSVRGRVVIDVWGGSSSLTTHTPWDADTLVNVFSVGKGVTSLIAAMLVDQRLLDYDTKVASLWPEFAVHGKDQVTLRDLLGHRVGLPAVREALAPHAMYDWSLMTNALANEEPWWLPGTDVGYHVNTFGFLVGEFIRRATGKSIGDHVRQLIGEPLGADIYCGLPRNFHSRVAEFDWVGNPTFIDDTSTLTEEQLLQYNTYFNPRGISGHESVNTTEWRLAEIPSTNMHASARGVCAMYTPLAQGGSSLISGAGLRLATTEVSRGEDRVLHRNSRFGHGFQLPLPERGFGPNPEAFGHFGAGGAMGFADPKAEVGFGYVMNQMGPRWQNPRNKALLEALYACL